MRRRWTNLEEVHVDYRDRHVVVTGGAGALGRAVVGALIEAGATCHVPAFADEAQRFPLRDHPQVKLSTEGDLADEAAVARLFATVPRLWASIHIAGGFAAAPVVETGKAELMRQVDMNFVTCFLCCRAAVSAMTKGEGGRIVNVAARPALEWRSGAGMAAYTASKAAVAALTVALAEEVAKQGILVNAIAPSILDTPANRQAMPKADHAAWPKVEEVAQTVLFLASPENRVTRGAVVPVYGKS
jgi:NAD(P)-dependent dehydrogenase (short-subunit alcohol dehydrogenase family)